MLGKCNECKESLAGESTLTVGGVLSEDSSTIHRVCIVDYLLRKGKEHEELLSEAEQASHAVARKMEALGQLRIERAKRYAELRNQARLSSGLEPCYTWQQFISLR